MREILIDEAAFAAPCDVHAHLARELDFPSHYGANLDALNDCLTDVDEAVCLSVYLSDDAEEEPMAAWFPKLCRTLLRASRDNDCLEVMVRATSLSALVRLGACPGVSRLLEDDGFIVQGLVGRLSQAHNEEMKRGYE